MQIREYQEWLEAWDKARGWDRVALSHTLIHAMEELGEVARLVLQWEGYKDPGDPAKLAADLEEELSDVFVFLFKLAYQTGRGRRGRPGARPGQGRRPLCRSGQGARRCWSAIMNGRRCS